MTARQQWFTDTHTTLKQAAYVEPDGENLFRLYLTIGNQQFEINSGDPRPWDEAYWTAQMLGKALDRLTRNYR